MAKQKRTILDNLSTRLRELLDELGRLLNPQQPKRARVPVPVRAPRSNHRNPYGQ
ncbi:MAG: hypothetical protein J0L63_14030 [Anaerolineae bacterium]|nr:hypothetical protein [Anaerolineae bacterium]MBN8620023.1 hypothetical protein [Anaerolineae bacterium]